MPTVTFVGTPFLALANYESRALGFYDLSIVEVSYPITGVAKEEARRRATAVFDKVVQGLFGVSNEAGQPVGAGQVEWNVR